MGLLNIVAETLKDPSSGEGSMSRLGTGVITAAIPAFMALCSEGKLSPEAIEAIKLVLMVAFPSVSLVYGINSALGAWRRAKDKGGGDSLGEQKEAQKGKKR